MKRGCDCDGFEDRFSHATGHYTVAVHGEDCPNHPSNFDPPEPNDERD